MSAITSAMRMCVDQRQNLIEIVRNDQAALLRTLTHPRASTDGLTPALIAALPDLRTLANQNQDGLCGLVGGQPHRSLNLIKDYARACQAQTKPRTLNAQAFTGLRSTLAPLSGQVLALGNALSALDNTAANVRSFLPDLS